VTHDDPVSTAKIALAWLNEFSDYYTRLDKMKKRRSEAIQSMRNRRRT
jgi:hypothetical protein